MIGQKIFADDVCSMYPSVNAFDAYAVGFKRFYKPTVDEIMDDSFIGVVKCDVAPPTDLYIPVLPSRVKTADESERLTFDLNPKTSVWASCEIKMAVERGYKITILAGYKFERLTGLMKEYVEEFLKMKTCNSGVKTAEECEKLNEEHRRLGLNIVIKPEETANNPGMKAIAKLCLNSLWGKFGQRANLDSYDFYDDKHYNQFINKLLSNKITTKGWEIVNENCVELH